jgi:hypothetical protein
LVPHDGLPVIEELIDGLNASFIHIVFWADGFRLIVFAVYHRSYKYLKRIYKVSGVISGGRGIY